MQVSLVFSHVPVDGGSQHRPLLITPKSSLCEQVSSVEPFLNIEGSSYGPSLMVFLNPMILCLWRSLLDVTVILEAVKKRKQKSASMSLMGLK